MNRSWKSHTTGPVAVALAVCLGLLSSCGGHSGPSDAKVIQASLVRLSDLPRGHQWKDTGKQKNKDKGLNAAINACERRYDPTTSAMVAQQDSHDFEGGADSISSTGGIVREEAKRNAFFSSLDRQFACFGRALAKSMNNGAAMAVDVAPPYVLDVQTAADRTAGRSLQMAVKDQSIVIYLDVVAVEKGDLLAGYVFLHAGDITLADETEVVDRALARVGDQQNG